MKFDVKKLNASKVFGVVTAVGMGIYTVVSALSEQKRDEEFEEMKKTLSELNKEEKE